MRKMARVRIVALAMIFTCTSYLGCSLPKPQIESVTQHDSLMFKGKVDQIDGLDTIVQKVNFPSLRDHFVASGDLEVRIWRGFALQPLEAVFIRRISGNWSGAHVVTDDAMPKNVKLSPLKKPSSGWANLWKSFKEHGLLEISAADADPCLRDLIDSTLYLVEISEKGRYRNYLVPDGYEPCSSSLQMARIGEIVGLEFDDGKQKCTTAEWFPCMTYRNKKGLR